MDWPGRILLALPWKPFLGYSLHPALVLFVTLEFFLNLPGICLLCRTPLETEMYKMPDLVVLIVRLGSSNELYSNFQFCTLKFNSLLSTPSNLDTGY